MLYLEILTPALMKTRDTAWFLQMKHGFRNPLKGAEN